jgi:hypothetical protein
MKPELKAPGTNLLTLKSDDPLSTFAFKFNLRRYNTAANVPSPSNCGSCTPPDEEATCTRETPNTVTTIDDGTYDDETHRCSHTMITQITHTDDDEAHNAVTTIDEDTFENDEAARARLLLATHIKMNDAAGARTSCPLMPGSVPGSGR